MSILLQLVAGAVIVLAVFVLMVHMLHEDEPAITPEPAARKITPEPPLFVIPQSPTERIFRELDELRGRAALDRQQAEINRKKLLL